MVLLSSSGTTFKFDIIKFAQDVMAEVDNIRSYLPTVGDDSQQADNRPIESRVNAFFRLIGLPMFVSITPKNDKDKSSTKASSKVMTPGFVHGGQPNGIIANSKDQKMEDPFTKKEVSIQTLLDKREQTLLKLERQIGTKDRDNRRASALYYPLELILDKNGADQNKLIMFKMVSPFAVSYMKIYPAQNELSKPFLVDPEKGRPPPDSTPIRRPFIETVIRIRTSALGGGNERQASYLEETRDRLTQLSPDLSNLLPSEASMYEAFIIDQMLGSLDRLASLWVQLQRRCERITKDKAIVLKPKTSSAKANSFGKQGNFALELDLPDNSILGQRRTALNRAIAVSEAMIGLLPTDDIVSLNGEKTKNVMSNGLTNAFTSVLRQPVEVQRKKLDELNSELNNIVQQADRLRIELETITGEFSGLSMPDVIFTILGLFLLDTEDLIGLLDFETLDEMNKDPVLKAVIDGLNLTPAATGIKKLQDKVNDLYDALNVSITMCYERNKRTSKNSPQTTVTSDLIERFVDKSQIVEAVAAETASAIS